MSGKFEIVKNYLFDMGVSIIEEDVKEELFVVEDEENGIKNLIVDCEDSILIIEQVIMLVPSEPKDLFKRLLQINRELVHGAFVMDIDGEYILFRDTLQLENLDRNELEASIHALSLALAEYGEEMLGYVV
jgi:hypothetical protein